MMKLLRQIALQQQGLGQKHHFKDGIEGTYQAIEHLGYVQIDTISVVERAHHHVLWNRVEDYTPQYLNQLVEQKKIFEHWFHAASYLPMKDYRFVLPHMQHIRSGEHRYFGRGDAKLMNEMLARIRSDGKLSLRDLEKTEKKAAGGWWNRSADHRALEQLFMQGDLMICERKGMEKIYDLTERCIAPDTNLTIPTTEEYSQYLFDTTLRAHGVFTWKQLIHLKTGTKIRETMREILNEKIDAGIVKALTIDDGQTIYADSSIMASFSMQDKMVKLLSPFDNLVIHRDRLNSLFNYDYRIECYVPAAKRVYGYFCLPILYGDELVGRIDCKAHRSRQQLEIISLYFEQNFKKSEHFIDLFIQELHHFSEFNQCKLLHESLGKIDH